MTSFIKGKGRKILGKRMKHIRYIKAPYTRPIFRKSSVNFPSLRV